MYIRHLSLGLAFRIAKAMDVPAINKKDGNTQSAVLNPCHSVSGEILICNVERKYPLTEELHDQNPL
jgi:hypothetical protein